jgi:hypothetical protein
MRDVSRQARRVLIWLGEETTTDCHAFDIVAQLGELLPDLPWNMKDVRAYNTWEAHISNLNALPASSWAQLVHLLERT